MDNNLSMIMSAYGHYSFAWSLHLPKLPGNQVHNDYSNDSKPRDGEEKQDTLEYSSHFGMLPTLTDKHKGMSFSFSWKGDQQHV